ncbi:MAG: WD40 repeat domain-containing protein [Planctomycetaceae bacterium]|jgi:WD40 repeat protein|nr:WD40 repeat domain-containing protein [Planctomycetaceae bacterium]
MMFSKRIRFFLSFGFVFLFAAIGYTTQTAQTVGQTIGQIATQTTDQKILEPSETIRLYEQITNIDRVPVITCIDLEKNGRLLAIGGDDCVVRLWDVQTKGFIRELQEHLDWVRGLAFSPDQTRLATVGQDGQIKLWDVQNGTLVRSLKGFIRGTQKVLFHPNGSQFAVCGFEKNVRIYDAASGDLLKTLETHGTSNKAIAFSPEGSLLAVSGRTGVIRVWKTSGYQQLTDLKGDGRRVHTVAFSPDGSQLASGGDGPFIMIWKPTDGTLLQSLQERPGKTFSLVFCGKTLLASGESDNAIRIWDITQNRNTLTLLGHTGTISTMIYEAASNRLISGSFDTSLRFWILPEDSVPSQQMTTIPSITTPTTTDSPVAATPIPTIPTMTAPAEPVPTLKSPFDEPINTTTLSIPIAF